MEKTESVNLGYFLMQKRKNEKLTQAEVAEYFGVNPKTISRWEGGSAIPKNKKIIVTKFLEGIKPDIKMPVAIQVDNNGKVTIGKSKRRRKPVRGTSVVYETNHEEVPAEPETRPHVPADVAAGALNGLNDAIMAYECEQRPIIKRFPNYDMTITVKGNSMEPKYEGGDELAIKEVSSFIEWGKPHVLSTRDGAVLKRIYDDGECYRCVSYNSEYPDFTVRKDDVFGVYRIVGLIRI